MTKLLVTGGSGLLGRSLIRQGLENGLEILGQYRHRQPGPLNGCSWLQGDFSSSTTLRQFLERNHDVLAECACLVNGYGPLRPKPTSRLQPGDYLKAFHHNVTTAVEITDYLLNLGSALKSVVNLGFEKAGEITAYKQILPYAVAKNSLLLITLSQARSHRNVRFNMVSPVTIEGAEFPLPGGARVAADRVSAVILELLRSDQTGRHIRLAGEE